MISQQTITSAILIPPLTFALFALARLSSTAQTMKDEKIYLLAVQYKVGCVEITFRISIDQCRDCAGLACISRQAAAVPERFCCAERS
jgi:hypothetical protein